MEQPRLSQPGLRAEVLQPSEHFCDPLWTLFNIFDKINEHLWLCEKQTSRSTLFFI